FRRARCKMWLAVSDSRARSSAIPALSRVATDESKLTLESVTAWELHSMGKARAMKAKFQETIERLSGDPIESARAVGLRYVSDATAGFRREKSGKNFKYFDAGDKIISDPATLIRIKALA